MINIIDAKPYHAGRMARILRAEHDAALRSAGVNVHRELRWNLANSSWAKAGFIDDRLVGLGGVTGSPIAPEGFVWLALADEVRKHPIAATRVLRDLLAEMMQTRHELATIVIPEDDAALRLAVFMGFHVKHDGDGGRAYSRVARRALAHHLRTNPDLRLSLGKSSCVALGYHEEGSRDT